MSAKTTRSGTDSGIQSYLDGHLTPFQSTADILIARSSISGGSPFTLTNASATGPIGPTELQCQSEYSGDILNNLEVNFGYQSYTITQTATYRFTVKGASGGVWQTSPMSSTTAALAPTIDGYKRLPGAIVIGEVSLNANDVITVVVGQGGGDDNNTVANCPGGGGGTFVTLGTFADVQNGTDTLLFVAGGGAGIGYTATDGPQLNYSIGVGQSGTSGGTTSNESGGTLGSGSPSSQGSGNSSGGGGYLSGPGNTTTANFTYSTPNRIPAGFRQGATGGSFTGLTRGFGGFGCGGNGAATTTTDDDKGGGGGYSGGGYGFDASESGGGGGSYIIGTASNTSSTAGGNTTDRHGSVLIEFV